MISLFASILNGNNIEIKRNFLQNQGFGVFIQFLEEITRFKGEREHRETINKIIAKLIQIIEDFLRYEEYIDADTEILNLEEVNEVK